MFRGLHSLLEESNRTPFSSNREHKWLKISVLALQSALSGLRWTFSELHELHAFVVFAELKIFHFHCVVFLTAVVTKELRQKPPHIRNKHFLSFWNQICLPPSATLFLLQLNFWLYLNVYPYRVLRSCRAFPSKTCLEEWNSPSLNLMENLYPCSFKCLSSVAIITLKLPDSCFLLQRRMFHVACLVFLGLFPRFYWQYFSVCTTYTIYFQPERRTLYCVWVYLE